MSHRPQVERYESKKPYLNSMIARAQQIARHPYLCYANCDIILFSNFLKAFGDDPLVAQRFSPRWAALGRWRA
jgi:hypothetical protein